MYNEPILIGWCSDLNCGEPIRGVAGQRCPKLCLPCAVKRATGIKQPEISADDPRELILDVDYRQLRDTSEEENQD